MNPTEYITLTIGYHLTKEKNFDLNVIRRGLKVANSCALQARTPEEFRKLMELKATRFHDMSEQNFQELLD